jgi:hypothetical protein
MSKIEIHYDDTIDAPTKAMLESRADVIRQGWAPISTSWLIWAAELNASGHPMLTLTEYSRPEKVVLSLPLLNIERMSDDSLRERVGGIG